jgi:pyruvate dehydrogenase E2 component (dihydrolipoamide acetyltransferase)
MATSIVMPALEMAQETGKIVSWMKKEGDSIRKGEPILEVETDKAVVEVESPADGILAGIQSREGDVIPVGQTIGWIVAPGEQPPAETATAAPAARTMTAQTPPAATAAPVTAPAARASGTTGSPQISPKARRLAQEKGVDLSRVRGTGPDGIITSDDVLAAAAATAATAAPADAAPSPQAPPAPSALSAVARIMAERTTQSWTSAPHFFLVREVDAGALNDAREKLGPGVERDRSVKLTHTDLLVAIVARVLTKHPKMNASWSGNGVTFNPDINISVAMAVKDGVVGAVIPKTNTTLLADVAVQRKDLTERARDGKLRPADISGGTFSITNLGMYDIDAFSAIIVPPQAAILAVGKISDRVVPVNGLPGIRPMLTLTLSSDHRVVDGAQAAAFLKDLAEAIRSPESSLSIGS